MREIKFRYWCRYECEMYPKAYMEEHMDLAFMSELLEAAQKRYILMQYTGLTDRNGIEIYEGDIIQEDLDSWGIVVWNEEHAMFSVYMQNVGPNEMLSDFTKGGKIIGNIYEHPELLEG